MILQIFLPNLNQYAFKIFELLGFTWSIMQTSYHWHQYCHRFCILNVCFCFYTYTPERHNALINVIDPEFWPNARALHGKLVFPVFPIK